jgi:hypothetical protein
METYVLVGYLMIRDAMRDKSRESLAEKYVLDAESDFEARYLLATSGDTTVIDKHSEIIDY